MGQSIPSKTFEWTSSSRERCQNTANFRLRLHIIIIIACWWWLGASHVISQNWCPLTQHTVATDSTSTKTFNWLTDSKEISCRLPFNTQSSWTGRSAKVKTLWKTVHHQLKHGFVIVIAIIFKWCCRLYWAKFRLWWKEELENVSARSTDRLFSLHSCSLLLGGLLILISYEIE